MMKMKRKEKNIMSQRRIVYSVLCTVYSVLCTVYSALCTVYSVLCTVYSVLCTVFLCCKQVDIMSCIVYSFNCVL